MTDLLNLAERLEQAEAPTNELNAEFTFALNLPLIRGVPAPEYHRNAAGLWYWDQCGEWSDWRRLCDPNLGHYAGLSWTHSLDQMLTLVPAGLLWRLRQYTNHCEAGLREARYDIHVAEGRAKIPALALGAAILRAKARAE